MAYLLNLPVYEFLTILFSLVLLRYMVIAIHKHALLPGSLGRLMNTVDASTTHGSAQLCSKKRLCQLNHPEGFPIGGIVAKSSDVSLERLTAQISKTTAKEILRLKVDHSVVIAPSGAGKGVGIVIPTLLDYSGSVLVTDIKGENYAVTAQARRRKGRTVYAIDPFRITDDKSTVTFNVLDLLDPTQESIVDDSATLASLLCPVPAHESGGTQYFASQAAALIQCLILHVVGSSSVAKEDRHLGSVYDALCEPTPMLTQILKDLADSDIAYGAATRLANGILGTEERELSATKNSARVELRFLDSPEVRRSLRKSTFSLTELVLGMADLYLCIPSEKLATQSRVLRLVIGATFMVLQRARGRRSSKPLLMLLDEMPALGWMPQIENALVYGRGYGVSLMVISQTIGLLRAVYPQTCDSFLSSHLSVFFGTTDLKTAELVSTSLGKMTVQSHSENKGQSKQENKKFGSFAITSDSTTSSYSETGRSLLNPDEVRRLDSKVLIAFLRGENPILLQRLTYLTHPHYKGRFSDNILHKD